MPDSARLHGQSRLRFVASAQMHSLADLRHLHSTCLVIDTASTTVQVGLLQPAQPDIWLSSEEDAGQGLFRCLEQLPLPLKSIAAIAFCEGPGSLLGIRTAAMALRVWNAVTPRPLYAFQSLTLIAHALKVQRAGITLIADARRETWHTVKIGPHGEVSSLERHPTASLQGPLVMPDRFRSWSTLPAHLERTGYALHELFAGAGEAPLFLSTRDPEAFVHETPAYVTWTPHIHRAPE